MKFSFDKFLLFVVLSLDDSYKIDSFLRKSMRILPFMYQNRAGGVGEKMKGSLSVNKMTSTLKKSSLSGGSLLWIGVLCFTLGMCISLSLFRVSLQVPCH